MTILQLNPLSPSVAISEIIILLLFAALIGYLIGRWITKGQRKQMESVLESKEIQLNDCKAQQKLNTASLSTSAPVVNTLSEVVRDDLKLIEGIGPKIERLLNAGEIYNFAQLSSASPERLNEILREAGPRFQMHDAGTWPEQAALARDGRWDELEILQERLSGGRDA